MSLSWSRALPSSIAVSMVLTFGCLGKDVGDGGSSLGDSGEASGEGDGDGDPGDGDPGDGDPGDGDPGDGDPGDGDPGDGDGDPAQSPCDLCLNANCAAPLAACEADMLCGCILSCVRGGQAEGICVQDCGLEDPPGLYHELLYCMTNNCADPCSGLIP